MAKVLSDKTAIELRALLDRAGSSQASEPGDPRDTALSILPDFRVTQCGALAVRVYPGVRVRNGVHLGISNVDSGKTYCTITGLSAASVYYVYGILSHSTAGFHPAVQPDTLTIAAALTSNALFAADSFANPTTSGNVVRIIAKVTTGTANVTIEPWYEHDDEWVYIPDSWGIAAGGGVEASHSLDLTPSNITPQGYLLELREFYAGIETAIKDGDTICFREVVDLHYELKYCTTTSLGSILSPHIDMTTIGGDGLGGIDYWITFYGDGHYWKQGDSHSATCFGTSIGRGNAAGSQAIDLNNSQLIGDDGTTIMHDWDVNADGTDQKFIADVYEFAPKGVYSTFLLDVSDVTHIHLQSNSGMILDTAPASDMVLNSHDIAILATDLIYADAEKIGLEWVKAFTMQKTGGPLYNVEIVSPGDVNEGGGDKVLRLRVV